MIKECPSCGTIGRITAVTGVMATHVCIKCGQGWRSIRNGKGKEKRVQMDLRAVTGEMTFGWPSALAEEQ